MGPQRNETFPLRGLRFLFRRYLRELLLAGVIAAVSSGLALLQPALVNRLLSDFDSANSKGIIWALLSALFLASALNGLETYLLHRAAERAIFDLRIELGIKILHLPIGVRNQLRSGDLVSRITSDCDRIKFAFTSGIVEAISGVITVVGSLVLMARIDAVLLGIVFLVILASVLLISFCVRFIERGATKAQVEVGRLAGEISNILYALKTIKAARGEDLVASKLRESTRGSYVANLRVARITSLLSPSISLTLNLNFLAVLGIGGARVMRGDLTTPDLISFVLYLFLLAMPLGNIGSAFTAMGEARGALRRVFNILELPNESASGSQCRLKGDIVFEDVSYTFPGGFSGVKDVSCRFISPGLNVVTGPSGVGKSTLLDLIEKFYDPDSGLIQIGEIDISTVSTQSLRGQIAYLEQEAPILPGTVRENLSFGEEPRDDHEYWAVLERVSLAGRFESLEDLIAEQGSNLSGGQRQRLAIARSLLADKPIWILDEPTSALDTENERRLMSLIKRAASTKTIVIVSHREAVMEMADNIINVE